MRYAHLSRSFLWAVLISALAVSSCQQVEPNTATASTPSAAARNDGKIAITTSSEEARKEYLAGRDLQEKLRITDSIAHFDKALSLDPNFALAELNRANVSPTATHCATSPSSSGRASSSPCWARTAPGNQH